LSEKQYYGNQLVGLKGKIFYSERVNLPNGNDINSELMFGTHDDFGNIQNIENSGRSPGRKELNGVLFLSRVFVPSRFFNRGFTKEGNYAQKHFYNPGKFGLFGIDPSTFDENKASEQVRKNLTINEWFQIKAESDFVLPSGKTAGYYTFGAIVDDGLLIKIKDPATGNYVEVNMDQISSPRFKAALGDDSGQKRVQRLYMEPGKTYKFEMNYFQAPANSLAHVLLFKKVETASTNIGQSDINPGNDDYFFTRASIDPETGFQKEAQGMKDLRADKWDIIAPEFFRVRGGINPCMTRAPADIVSGASDEPLTATEIQEKIEDDLIKVTQ
jgi:hypothetical protein